MKVGGEMKYITKEHLIDILKNKEVIKPEDLIHILEEELDYSISNENKYSFSFMQKEEITKRIFNNKDIQEQIDKSEEDMYFIEDENEFIDFVKEVQNVNK